MAKAPTAPKLTAEQTEAAASKMSNSLEIKGLVGLANIFSRAGTSSYSVDIPLLAPVMVEQHGYRRSNIPAGTIVEPDQIYIGKKQGLIFKFKPVSQIQREGKPILAIELGWEDLCGHLPSLHARLNDMAPGKDATAMVLKIDTAIRSAITKNPGMHAVLSQGFVKAQTEARAHNDDVLEENPLWGAF